MVPTRQSGEAARGFCRHERTYGKPLILSLIKAKLRSVVKMLQQKQQETIMFDGFYIGLGDRFDDDRRRVPRASSYNEIRTSLEPTNNSKDT
jgi:hypothetical protein